MGATGLALVCVLPHVTPLVVPLLRPFLETPWILNALLLFPSGLMEQRYLAHRLRSSSSIALMCARILTKRLTS